MCVFSESMWLPDVAAAVLSRLGADPGSHATPLADVMVVAYQAYDIAPYAAGQPTLAIPYDQLKGMLKPRLLPGSG